VTLDYHYRICREHPCDTNKAIGAHAYALGILPFTPLWTWGHRDGRGSLDVRNGASQRADGPPVARYGTVYHMPGRSSGRMTKP